MLLLQNQTLLSFLQLYGLFSLFVTYLFLTFLIKNYLLHKDFFFSLKNIKLNYQKKEIENLKKTNESLNESIKKVQSENDELSKIIISKIR